MQEKYGLKDVYQLFKRIFDESPIGIVITNTAGDIEFVNKTICDRTGYSAEELIGKNPRILKSGVHPEAFFKKMWETILKGHSWNEPFCNKKKNGELYWEQQYIFPLKNENDQIIRFIAIKVDITQQKQYEEKLIAAQHYLNSIFQALPVLLLITTPDGLITEVMAHDELLLYAERQHIINRKVNEIFPPEKAQLFESFISKTIGTDKTHIIEYELETLKGTRWFEARSGIVKNEKEKSVIILINDITERIKYEKQLKDLIATKDKFFSIIAHDLKNPLHAIMGISEMLYSKTYSNENVVEFAKMLYESGQSANELLENLLEWSRSQTGKISFNPSPQNVAALANETIELLLNHAQNKNIFLQNEIDENIEWKVDKNIVKTILRNLLSNAIKFTQEGGVVKIKAETLTDRLKICVEDNGKGIKPEIIATLFTTSAPSTIGTQNEKGSGLGLLLCKELIGIHKGRIYVESTVGEGSKFTFELPA